MTIIKLELTDVKSKIIYKLIEQEKSQTFIAEKMGVSKQTVNAWVKGRMEPPLSKAFKLAKLLQCKIEDLWEYDE